MVIAHNLTAMNAQRQYGLVTRKKAKTTEKLSSGYKINRAADDAAGLSISEKMRKQIRGLSQGVDNTQDGVSICQVADGALAEVNEMLHRITELSVKAANETNSEQDRKYIQEEITQILEEIDRVGETTTFNDRPIFQGYDRIIVDENGNNASVGNIPFSDFTLADMSLGKQPITSSATADTLFFQATVNNPDSVFHNQSFNLIFGNGSTSSSSFRITDANGNKTIVGMESAQVTKTDFQADAANNTWSREYTYTADGNPNMTVKIKQTIKAEDVSDTEKQYVIDYEFLDKGSDVSNLEFMFHADTAYNNNDRCEGYFIGGQRVDKYCVYSNTAGSDLTNGATSQYVYNTGIPDSLSIVDVDNALAFSEKISFNGDRPDSMSIGFYNDIDEWTYYNSLNANLGEDADHKDLGFSLYYNMGDLTAKNKFSFNYGIVSTEADTNLTGVTVKKDINLLTDHAEKLNLWIHSGAERDDGLYLTIGEMNTEILGIDKLNVTTTQGAREAMDSMDHAIKQVSSIRSIIGAQQNRMEHIIDNEENIVENTTAAESRIRDTDMAKEMVQYSLQGILEQAGQSMLSQANQSNQGILSLLQ